MIIKFWTKGRERLNKAGKKELYWNAEWAGLMRNGLNLVQITRRAIEGAIRQGVHIQERIIE